MPPPLPNQVREAAGEPRAPVRFRLPWCSACFFGFTECKKQHCEFRDRLIPEA
jgi:hypothetical protein